MPSNNKKRSSTLPPMPSKETVKQELRIIAGALFKGSRLSGSESDRIIYNKDSGTGGSA